MTPGFSGSAITTVENVGRAYKGYSNILPQPVRIGHGIRWLTIEIEAWLAAAAPDRLTWENENTV